MMSSYYWNQNQWSYSIEILFQCVYDPRWNIYVYIGPLSTTTPVFQWHIADDLPQLVGGHQVKKHTDNQKTPFSNYVSMTKKCCD